MKANLTGFGLQRRSLPFLALPSPRAADGLPCEAAYSPSQRLHAGLADKAFDADWLLQDLDERGATAVIPPKSNRKVQRDYDTHMYKWRHLVENYFAKIKEFRGIATRYDKTDTSYAANWYLCATIIAAR